jgi:ATP-dependent Lon protease
MFITTANILDPIPPALRDRMEVLELLGYTQDEKIKIATRYLVPRQREAHGLKASQISFTRGTLQKIISGYTREAGVRNLERGIATICRGVATRIAEGEAESAKIRVKDIASYMGPVRFVSEVSARTLTPGLAMGLAWTQAGGELLFVEATAMKGSFIRSNAVSLGIAEDFFETQDIHIHIPAGAIPKDGPSAGVTMLTALVSLLTHKKIQEDLAMTGEITLRGQVLPVGGVKEKVLAAHRAGIKTIIMPSWNKKDLEDIPEKVKKEIHFYFVDKMMNVLKIALEK